MKNSTSTTNKALQKMIDLKLKALLENDLRNFRIMNQVQTNPVKANQAIAA
ncbi:hypothetical protein [Mucilaginibacter flavidus]|uniref:hypothetical protein n=1 Tax=Mucilaginibacter flavidus TaxID=2949309 RepID=UPI0020926941|nr:hypothetical protein [Mucilaginibacter flavidus]MCO5948655.1 hypothetical protein [Mucilaginibacter flavidus]